MDREELEKFSFSDYFEKMSEVAPILTTTLVAAATHNQFKDIKVKCAAVRRVCSVCSVRSALCVQCAVCTVCSVRRVCSVLCVRCAVRAVSRVCEMPRLRPWVCTPMAATSVARRTFRLGDKSKDLRLECN